MSTIGARRASSIQIALPLAPLAAIGFAASFEKVSEHGRTAFGMLAPFVSIGVDVGILVYSGYAIHFARTGNRTAAREARLIAHLLTVAMIALNLAGETDRFGQVAHVALPLLWVAGVDLVDKDIRHRLKLAAGPGAQERVRLRAVAALRDRWGLFWRLKAPAALRLSLRLGELTEDAVRAHGMVVPQPRSGARSGTRTRKRPGTSRKRPSAADLARFRTTLQAHAAEQPDGLLSIREAAAALGCGNNLAVRLLDELELKRVGRRRPAAVQVVAA